jgi:hypothetical protein
MFSLRASSCIAVGLLLLRTASAEPAVSEVSALPGLWHTAAALDSEAVAVATSLAVGTSSGVVSTGDRHSRVRGLLGVAAPVAPGLNLGLSLDGRYDRHALAGNLDEALSGQPRLQLHAARGIAGALRAGLRLGVLLPGAEAPSLRLSATSFDLLALLSWRDRDRLVVSGNLGYRADRTASLVGDARATTPGDRLALGVSSWDAALLRLGAVHRFGQLSALLELSQDLLVGPQAPAWNRSPMRMTGGVRWALGACCVASAMAEYRLSANPDLDEPGFVPLEPRIQLGLGLSFQLGTASARAAAPSYTPVMADTTRGWASGRVVDEHGAPVAGAAVRLRRGRQVLASARTDAQGYFRAGVPGGTMDLEVFHEGYRATALKLAVTPGATASFELSLLSAAGLLGELRGAVSTPGKTGIAAQVRIPELQRSSSTDADGSFSFSVPPGSYEVLISAPDFIEQRRRVRVDEAGVTILNVDLQRAARRRSRGN